MSTFDYAKRFFHLPAVKFFYAVMFSVYIFINAVNNPFNNWDMIGYVSSVLHSQGGHGQELQQKTFEDIRSYVPSDVFLSMTSGSSYVETVYSDHESLSQQLPFYRIRIAYVGLVSWASVYFDSIAKATVFVGAFFATLFCLVAAWCFSRLGYFFYTFPVIVLLMNIKVISTISTPDTMASFFALFAILLYKRFKFASLTIVTFLPLIRTDFIILTALFFLVRLYKKGNRLDYLFFAFSLLAYFFANKLAGNYGYMVIFNFTLIPGGKTPYPSEIILSGSVNDYLMAYYHGILSLVSRWEFFAKLVALAIIIVDIKGKGFRDDSMWALVSIMFILIHFAAFPAAFQRTYLFANFIIVYFIASRIFGERGFYPSFKKAS